MFPKRTGPPHSDPLPPAGGGRGRSYRRQIVQRGSNVTPELAAEMGLSADEFARAAAILGRTPNLTETGVFAAMWSEHCSYKSSKVWLKTLPTEGERVICGPGENA